MKHRANQVAALIQSFQSGQTIKAYETALNSAGSATEENARLADSLKFKLNQLQASFENLSQSVVSSSFLKDIIDFGGNAIDTLSKLVNEFGVLTVAIAGISAMRGLTSGKFLFSSATVESFKQVNKQIGEYNAQLNDSKASQSSFIHNIEAENVGLSKHLKSLDGAKASMGGYVKSLIVAQAKTLALNVAMGAMNAGISLLVGFAISKLIKSFTDAAEAEKKMMENFESSTSKRQDEAKTIEESIAKYEELTTVMQSHSSTAEQISSAKEQLQSIQDSLISSYGSEADALDLVNGKYDDQIAKINELNKNSAKQYVAKNANAYEKAQKYLTQTNRQNTQDYLNFEFTNQADAEKAKRVFSQYGAKREEVFTGSGLERFYFEGKTKEQLYDAYAELYSGLEKEFGKDNPSIKNIQSAISSAMSEIDMEKVNKYKEQAQEYVKNQIIANDTLGASYSDIESLISEYNKSVAKEDISGAEIISDKINKIKESIGNTDTIIEGSSALFDELFSTMSNSSSKASEDIVSSMEAITTSMSPSMYTDADITNIKNYQTQLSNITSQMKNIGSLSQSDALGIITEFKDFNWTSFGVIDADGAINIDKMSTAMQSLYDWVIKNAVDAFPELAGSMDMVTNSAKQQDESIRKSLENISQLEDVLKKVSSKHRLNADEISTLINKYPSLAGAVTKTGKAYTIQVDAIKNLINTEVAAGNTSVSSRMADAKATIETAKQKIAAIKAEVVTMQQASDGAIKYAKIIYNTFGKSKFKMSWEDFVGKIGGQGIDKQKKIISEQEKNLDKLSGQLSSFAESASKTTDKTDKTTKSNTIFDWIQVKLESISSSTQKAIDKIGDFYNFVSNNSQVTKALSAISREINNNNKAIDIYQKKANSLGLSSGMKSKIESGSFSISSISDEKTVEKINKYQEYMDKIESAKNKIEDLKAKEEELYQQRLENIKTYYSSEKSYKSAITSNIQARIDSRSSTGGSLTSSYYRQNLSDLATAQGKELELLKKEKDNYNSELIKLYKSGKIDYKTYIEGLTYVKELDTSIINLNSSIAETNRKINEINLNKLIDAKDKLDSEISLSTEKLQLRIKQGFDLKKSDYSGLISGYKDLISNISSQITETKKLQSSTKEGSELWKQYQSELNSLNSELVSTKSNMIDLQAEMIDMTLFKPFEDANTKAQNLISNISGLADLIDESLLYDKDGGITDLGITKLKLLQDEYAKTGDVTKSYITQIAKLNDAYKNGEQGLTSDTYNEKLQELKDGLISSAQEQISIYSELASIQSNANEEEKDALKKIIDLRKEALAKKKEYYEYDKNIKSQTKDIQSLNAQIAALTGVSTAEGKAQSARLKAQKAEAEQTLKDTIYEHQVELISDGLDNLSETIDDKVTELNNNVKEILNQIKGSIGIQTSANASEILKQNENILKDKPMRILGVASQAIANKSINIPTSPLSTSTSTSGGIVNINNTYDNLIKVEGNVDSKVISDVKNFTSEVYTEVTRRIAKDITKAR